MKLVHISDTHIGAGENADRLNRLVDSLLRNNDPESCVVLHTGDLIDSATGENRREARKILDRLAQNGFRVFLSPGNHDYGGKSGVDEHEAKIFKEEFASYIFDSAQQGFPVLTPLGDKYVLIGLDSNAAELNCWNRWYAEGHLGSAQLDRLNHMLDSDLVRDKKVVLYLHHHPFYYGYSVRPDIGDKDFFWHLKVRFTRLFRRLKDAYSLCQIIRDRVDVLCFGHMHLGLDCSGESGKYGIKLALDGGSTTCTEGDSDRMRCRIIDLDELTYKVRMIKIR